MLTVLLIVLAGQLLASVPAPWPDLSAWIGQYPTDEKASPPRKLLQLPTIRAKLRTLLGNADLRLLDAFVVEAPVATKDGFLLIKQCLPHDCGDRNAMIVIDRSQDRMWVGFFSRSATVVSTRWFGSADYRILPEAVLEEFRAQHQP